MPGNLDGEIFAKIHHYNHYLNIETFAIVLFAISNIRKSSHKISITNKFQSTVPKNYVENISMSTLQSQPRMIEVIERTIK